MVGAVHTDDSLCSEGGGGGRVKVSSSSYTETGREVQFNLSGGDKSWHSRHGQGV